MADRAADANPFGSRSDTGAARSATAVPCPLCGATATESLFHKHGYAFVRCAECSLVRLDPVPDAATLAEVYERSYRDGLYSVFAAADDVRAATARAKLAALRPHTSPGPWLDAGCSTGAFLAAASEAGVDIEGFDLSGVAVAEARGKGLRATEATADTFAPSQRYACVTAFDMIEHLIDPNPFLERARGWLLPEGRLAITVPDIASWQARLMGKHWYYYAPPVHISYFDAGTVTRLLKRHGFRPLAVVSAPKVLTIDYVLGQLAAFNPLLHRAARAAAALIPAGSRSRPLHIPVGEILVVAAAHATA